MIVTIVFLGIAALLVGLALWGMTRKKPMGFYSNSPAPEEKDLTDVPAYNRACGFLLMGYALLMALIGLGFPVMEKGSFTVLVMLTAFPGAIAMIVIYEVVILPRYSRKK